MKWTAFFFSINPILSTSLCYAMPHNDYLRCFAVHSSVNNWFFTEMCILGPLCLCMCFVLSATLSWYSFWCVINGIFHSLSYCMEIWIITMNIVCITLNTRSLRCDIKGSRSRQQSYRFVKIIENITEKKIPVRTFRHNLPRR